MPAVEFPDAEKLARDFLAARLEPTVATKVPNPKPDRFVRAWRTGGVAENRVVDKPIITVTCTAPDSVTAAADAGAARSAFLNESAAMPLVRQIEEITGLYYDPDPDTNEDRYSFSVQMTVRGRRTT